MNRADRRREVRYLHSIGCQCEPTFRAAPDGHHAGCQVVVHEIGCEFGDRMKLLNRAGYLPVIIFPTSPKCER